MKLYDVLLLFLMLLTSSESSFAQQSFQQQPQPWQRRSSQHGNYNPSSSQRYSVSNNNHLDSHYLEDPNWMTNEKNRPWSVSLRSRKPNNYSWTSRLLLANIAMYGLQMFRPGVTSWGVKLSDRILRGEELYRLLSPVFLHGSVYHLFTNMYSLNNVGPMTEHMFGGGRFLVSYLVAGAAGNLLSAIQSPNPALGASGAVFGVMASYYVFLNRHDWLFGRSGQANSEAITQTLIINLVLGAMNPMVDNWGHLGGAIGGAAMAYYFGPRLFLADLPGGGRMLVDRPILRLPRPIESFPERCSNMMQRMFRRLQVWRYKIAMPDKPWRPKDPWSKVNYQQRRSDTPNRSIKPKL